MTLSLLSCRAQDLQYYLRKGNAENVLKKCIYPFKNNGSEFFFILKKENNFNIIEIVLTNDLNNKKVYEMYIKNTNRKLRIGEDSYYVLFDFDYELSGKEDKIKEDNGKEYNIIRQKNYIYDGTILLFFDNDWNFIRDITSNINKNKLFFIKILPFLDKA